MASCRRVQKPLKPASWNSILCEPDGMADDAPVKRKSHGKQNEPTKIYNCCHNSDRRGFCLGTAFFLRQSRDDSDSPTVEPERRLAGFANRTSLLNSFRTGIGLNVDSHGFYAQGRMDSLHRDFSGTVRNRFNPDRAHAAA